jgi:hypothetical protein
MPFGQYKGRPVSEIPNDYLRWVLRACHVSRGLRDAIVEELQDGPELFPSAAADPPPEPQPAWSMAYYTCTAACCSQPGFWTLTPAGRPAELRCPACGSGAQWKGWVQGLGDQPWTKPQP